MWKIIEPLRNRVLIPYKIIPRDGLAPEKLALSVTIGIVSGLFPVIGLTTFLSLLLTAAFRQNLALVQTINWIVSLLQLLLIIPLMRMGALILDQQTIRITFRQIERAFQPGILEGLQTVGIFHLYGILAWSLLAIPVGTFLYFTLLIALRRRDT